MNILRCTLFVVLLALVLGVGCGGGKEEAKAPTSSVMTTLTNAAPQGIATPKAGPKVKESIEAEKGFAETKAKAESGDADAQLRLSGMYYKGEGVEKNHKEAVNWFRKAAEQGYEQAKTALKELSP